MKMNDYMWAMNDLLDGVELEGRMNERLACTVFAVGAR